MGYDFGRAYNRNNVELGVVTVRHNVRLTGYVSRQYMCIIR